MDEADFPLVCQHKWYARVRGNTSYAVATVDGRPTLLHRLLMAAERGQIIDHIDGDGLNNSRANLRLASHQQNMRNRRPAGGKSRFKGVFSEGDHWRVCIKVDRESVHLGSYTSEEKAARQYDRAARLFYGEFARTNEMCGLFQSAV